MQQSRAQPRTNHLELAQRILDIVRKGGFEPGARLAEQQIASLCSVSRTPVRAALRLLAERGAVEWRSEHGFRLPDRPVADQASASLPATAEDELAESILRDRAARRLDGAVTVAALRRRYAAEPRTVRKALRRLEVDNWIVKAPGQSWLFRATAESPDAVAESYDFRLLMEPAALLAPGFTLDETQATELRRAMETQLASADVAFDMRLFQRLDLGFHGLFAAGSGNRFLGEALAAHLRLRRLPGALHGVNVFRLKQSTREHLAILDHLETRQFEVAADLLRVHLRLSRSQRPQAASRGAPAFGGGMVRGSEMQQR